MKAIICECEPEDIVPEVTVHFWQSANNDGSVSCWAKADNGDPECLATIQPNGTIRTWRVTDRRLVKALGITGDRLSLMGS